METLSIANLSGRQSTVSTAELDVLSHQLRGSLIRAEDATYDEARRLWNGMFDKHPAVIVRCAGVADVIDAVRFAHDRNLLVAIRGGAHFNVILMVTAVGR